jgi:hypothetical protein
MFGLKAGVVFGGAHRVGAGEGAGWRQPDCVVTCRTLTTASARPSRCRLAVTAGVGQQSIASAVRVPETVSVQVVGWCRSRWCRCGSVCPVDGHRGVAGVGDHVPEAIATSREWRRSCRRGRRGWSPPAGTGGRRNVVGVMVKLGTKCRWCRIRLETTGVVTTPVAGSVKVSAQPRWQSRFRQWCPPHRRLRRPWPPSGREFSDRPSQVSWTARGARNGRRAATRRKRLGAREPPRASASVAASGEGHGAVPVKAPRAGEACRA